MTSLLFFSGPELAPGEPEAATAAVPAAARAATAQIVIRSFVRACILLLLSWFADNREDGRRARGFASSEPPGLSRERPGPLAACARISARLTRRGTRPMRVVDLIHAFCRHRPHCDP